MRTPSAGSATGSGTACRRTVDILTSQFCIYHDNTSTVYGNAALVRDRIRQYVEFGAIVSLPPDHPLPFGIQPLHVIIKTGKKPRLVIDLSRDLKAFLQYEYITDASVRDAVELSSPHFLTIDRSQVAAPASLSTAQRVMSAFGIVVNPDKTEGPAQRLAFFRICTQYSVSLQSHS